MPTLHWDKFQTNCKKTGMSIILKTVANSLLIFKYDAPKFSTVLARRDNQLLFSLYVCVCVCFDSFVCLFAHLSFSLFLSITPWSASDSGGTTGWETHCHTNLHQGSKGNKSFSMRRKREKLGGNTSPWNATCWTTNTSMNLQMIIFHVGCVSTWHCLCQQQLSSQSTGNNHIEIL